MILGHSDLPPLSLVAKPFSVRFPSTDLLLLILGCNRPYLDDSIKRALAERGERLRLS